MRTTSVVAGWMGVALACASVAKAQEPGKEWVVKQIGGVDYIPLENVGTFYRFGKVERKEDRIHLTQDKRMEVEFVIGSHDCRINRMKIVLERAIQEEDGAAFISRGDLGRVIDPILRPSQIKGRKNFTTVILDADGDALVIAAKTKAELEQRGFKVVMTREDDKVMATEERARLANEVQEPAVFICLTFEGSKDQPKGARMAVVMPPKGEVVEKGDGTSSLSVALGTALYGNVLRKLGRNTQDNGLAGDRGSGLSGIRHPSIVLTVANLADAYDARLAANEKFQKAVADGIADGVVKYRHAVTKPE